MNILFLTLGRISNIAESGIYTDLLREFVRQGHNVTVVSPNERRTGLPTQLVEEDANSILHVRTGNIQKTNTIEKGISTVLLKEQYKRAIKKKLRCVKYDIVLYSTPPITLMGIVKWIKKRDTARTYLLLKDIFPQNAVDLGILRTIGITAPLYRYFLRKEKALYALSDRIGCMSRANVDYILKLNPEVDPAKVEICPNCIEVRDMTVSEDEQIAIRTKYGLPLDKKVFVYGGNLGKPQGVPFIIECLRRAAVLQDAFFFIVGSGTEYGLLEQYVNAEQPAHVKLLRSIPKDEYDHMLAACDVGLIFLDHQFTIPNFPSRLLSYMQAGLPVLAATDTTTDVGRVIVDNGFGWWCKSDDAEAFVKLVGKVIVSELGEMGETGYRYLRRHYSVDMAYQTIIRGVSEYGS